MQIDISNAFTLISVTSISVLTFSLLGLYILPDFTSTGLRYFIKVQMRNVSPMDCTTDFPVHGVRISTSLNSTITLTISAFNLSEGISINLTKCLDHSTTQEFIVTVNATEDFVVSAELIDAVLRPSCLNITVSGVFLY